MGCMCTRNRNDDSISEENVTEKKYTWDDRRQINFNLSNYLIEHLDNKEEVRIPGSVNGQQFIIQNCRDCCIYVLDHLNTVTVDDCVNCKIILGPVKGSVFVRNCKGCTCVVACGQFRARDSRRLNMFLYCATQPIIEASSGIRFGSYQLQYKHMQDHLDKAALKLSNRTWDIIHDFTPIEGETNWDMMDNCKVNDYVQSPQSSLVSDELNRWEHTWAPLQQNEEDKVIEPRIDMETVM